MQVGDLCEVLGGPFEGKSGIVRDRDIRRHSVSLEIPKFEGTRSIELADLVVIADSLASLEVEASAVITASARAAWWVAAFTHANQDVDHLCHELDAWEARFLVERAAALTELANRVRKAFGALEPNAFRARWLAERETWLRPFRAERLANNVARLRQRVETYRIVQRLRERASEPTDPTLEAAIALEPSDDNFRVYADWLQEHGNPRGELIATELAGHPDEAARIRALRPLDCVNLAPLWRNGYLDAIELETTGVEIHDGLTLAVLTEAVFAHPASRFLRDLQITVHPNSPELRLARRETLRRLKLVGPSEVFEWDRVDAGDIGAPIAALYPNLEELLVDTGFYQFTPTAFPSLRRLVLEATEPRLEAFAALDALDGSLLTHLALSFSSDDVLPTAILTRILARPWPQLRSLSLREGQIGDAMVEAIVAAKLPLTHLELTRTNLTERGARDLVAHLRLEHLDVSENFLTPGMLAELRAAFPGVTSTRQYTS